MLPFSHGVFAQRQLVPIEFITSAGSVSSSPLAIPRHNSGDMIVFVDGNQSTTAPSLKSGYTNIGTIVASPGTGANRSARIQYIISNGNISSETYEIYGHAFVLRNASGVGATAFTNTTSEGATTTIPLPALTGCQGTGNEMILAGTFVRTITAVASPWVVTPPGLTGDDPPWRAGAYIENNSSSGVSSVNMTSGAALRPIAWVVEFI